MSPSTGRPGPLRMVRGRALRFIVEHPALGRGVWRVREVLQGLAAAVDGRSRLSRKLRHKMRWDRRATVAVFADKVAVRAHVEWAVGPGLLPGLHAVLEDPRELRLDALPDRFVIKPSHGSGAALIVHPAAAADSTIPAPGRADWWAHEIRWVRRDRFDGAAFVRLADHWLARDYLLGGRAYWHLPRRLVVEEFLAGEGDRPSPDYRLWTFHGQVRWIQVDLDWTGGLGGRAAEPRRSLHWPDWTPIDVTATRSRPERLPERPASLDRMIEVAEALAAATDMVRVDLYDLDGRVVFGELTNYPLGGRVRFHPPEFDRILGQWWHPPRRYREGPD